MANQRHGLQSYTMKNYKNQPSENVQSFLMANLLN